MKNTKVRPKRGGRLRRYDQMTDAERIAVASEEYDNREIPDSELKPLTPAMRKALKKAEELGNTRGRPRIGQGSERIVISVERGLLAETDALAQKCKQSRSQLIALALRQVIGQRGAA